MNNTKGDNMYTLLFRSCVKYDSRYYHDWNQNYSTEYSYDGQAFCANG